jgi:hypothetical protein
MGIGIGISLSRRLEIAQEPSSPADLTNPILEALVSRLKRLVFALLRRSASVRPPPAPLRRRGTAEEAREAFVSMRA